MNRQHPLDEWEAAMIDDDESYPPPVQVIVYTLVLVLCLVSWGLVIWWMWGAT